MKSTEVETCPQCCCVARGTLLFIHGRAAGTLDRSVSPGRQYVAHLLHVLAGSLWRGGSKLGMNSGASPEDCGVVGRMRGVDPPSLKREQTKTLLAVNDLRPDLISIQ